MKKPECPYCLECVDSDETMRCRTCGALHHMECWEENEGCSAKDCGVKDSVLSIDIEPDERKRLELSTEAIVAAKSHREGTFKNPCIKCGKIIPQGELYCEECEPPPVERSDRRNLAPMIVIFVVLSVLLWWLIDTQFAPDSSPPQTPDIPASEYIR